MVSPTALTCKHYVAGCTKTKAKILRPENSEKEKNAPDLGQKGRNRVRFGCWGGVQPVRTGGKPEIRTKMHQIAMQHMKKGNRRKPSVFAGFLVLHGSVVHVGSDSGFSHLVVPVPNRSHPLQHPKRTRFRLFRAESGAFRSFDPQNFSHLFCSLCRHGSQVEFIGDPTQPGGALFDVVQLG